LDVLLVDAVMLAFHMTAIFLFTSHLVLYEVKERVFPLIYIGALMFSCIYKLNTQILIHDETIIRKAAVRRNYIHKHLFIDLLMVTLSLLEFYEVNSSMFRLVAFVKLIDIRHILQKFEVIISVNRTGLILWQLLSIFLLNILVAHTISLIIIGMVDDAKQPNWMASASISRNQHDWFAAYTWALYWGTTIMLTIGFGDMTAKNSKEALIVTFVEMFSVIIFAYIINAIQSLLVSLREYDNAKYHNLSVVNRYMRNNNVPYDL
jgi:hypothetical protein